MLRVSRLRLAPLLALGVLAVFAFSACSAERKDVAWSSDITSAATMLHQAGSDNEVVYGWNRLVGQTTVNGEAAQVELLGNVAYDRGSGPIFGFVTLTFADGSTLGMQMNGEGKANADTTKATFQAKLTVLGGTGRYLHVTGSGSWSGKRDASLGAQVHMDTKLKLKGLPK
jgi:hypothetical protein